jgi:hypothetical protein
MGILLPWLEVQEAQGWGRGSADMNLLPLARVQVLIKILC